MRVTENSQPVGVKTLGDCRSPFVGQEQERLCGPMEGLEEVVEQVPQDAPVSSSVGAAPEPGLLSGLGLPSQCFLYSFLHGEWGAWSTGETPGPALLSSACPAQFLLTSSAQLFSPGLFPVALLCP